ncbi:MAG TPA: cysteine rich repeat-containing protein [Bradyrhizobium sp.]|nr:cysteine rich repeat-containing protein [Bradyrhizobium sp.]
MRNLVATKIAAGLILAMAIRSGAMAQAGPEPFRRMPEIRAGVTACMSDSARLCADVAPGQGRIVRCLARQPDQLSSACATLMQKASDALIAAGATMRPGLMPQ